MPTSPDDQNPKRRSWRRWPPEALEILRQNKNPVAICEELDIGPQEPEGEWFDSLPAASADPEDEAIRHEETAWLLKQFREEPELETILRLQLETDGYNAFTNLELARMLAVPVTEIENRKRRLKTRLTNLVAGRRREGAMHG